ncbi:hypothetical protein [Cupriavidus sp. 2SB]|uniref:hypothetical protein n=1 Tax=unclassified Cupriavidus TaxID=2640874 RepID=UPI0010F460F9|nr:hypothetical protein [Cupriavidus sp. 2SB]
MNTADKSWFTMPATIAVFTMSALLAGCADIIEATTKADPGGDAARVRFRLAEPGLVYIREAFATPCFYSTDATTGRIADLSYNTQAIRWIVEQRLDRIGMPGGEAYSSISYTEARVRAGKPVAIRLMEIVGNGNIPRYAQWTLTLEPGKDYEMLLSKGLGSVSMSQIVSGEGKSQLVPLDNAVRTPYCQGQRS